MNRENPEQKNSRVDSRHVCQIPEMDSADIRKSIQIDHEFNENENIQAWYPRASKWRQHVDLQNYNCDVTVNIFQ